jgi:hypothetical protein
MTCITTFVTRHRRMGRVEGGRMVVFSHGVRLGKGFG